MSLIVMGRKSICEKSWAWLGAWESEVDSLNKLLREQEREVEHMKDEKHRLEKTYQGVIQAAKDASMTLSRQLSEYKIDMDSLKARLRKSHNENLTAKERMNQLVDSNKHVCSASEDVKSKIKVAKKEIEKLEKCLASKVLECG